jgi:hypothetical protein
VTQERIEKGNAMSDELVKFTDEDKAMHPALGPQWSAAQRLAEALMPQYSPEILKPILDKAADQLRGMLWNDVRDWIIQDTEQNVAGRVSEMVEQTVKALLTGDKWAIDNYPFADYEKGEKIRAAVAKHGGDALLMARIADLEKQVENLEKWRERDRW